MTDIRAVFSKLERAKYISHLDLMRVFTRAFARARLPLWYTEGFNPHIYLTFALPLALGCESRVETLDFRIVEPVDAGEIQFRLNAVLPADIRILSVGAPVHSANEIAFADYALRFYTDVPEQLAAAYERFCAQPEITVTKKTKRTEKELDLKPLFTPLSQGVGEDCFTAAIRLVSGTQMNVSAALLLSALQPLLPPEDAWLLRTERTAVLLPDMRPFC